MTDYIVVKERNLPNFTAEVNEKIKQGYTTVGGVSKTTEGVHYYYMQAMAKLNLGI